MRAEEDAFVHHPELRGEILEPRDSPMRRFTTAQMAAKAAALGLPQGWWHADAEREAMRARTLAGQRGRDLWVFGYGSLMWDPAFVFAEVRRAHVPGYARRFILKDVYGGRGTKEAPGLMAALDAAPGGGEGCDGLLFRIPQALVEEETVVLWRRELIGPAYHAKFVTALVEETPIEALAFVADHDAAIIDATLTRPEQIHFLATGAGFLGSSLDYLRNVARKLEALDIQDEAVASLLREAEAYAAARGL